MRCCANTKQQHNAILKTFIALRQVTKGRGDETKCGNSAREAGICLG